LLDCSHEQIHLKWMTDLNDGSAVLVFVCHSEQIHVEHKILLVDRIVWATLLAKVKQECTGKFSFISLKFAIVFQFTFISVNFEIVLLC